MYNKALALLIVRLIVGTVFILHGGQKVLGWFGGHGLEGHIAFIQSLGMPRIAGYVSAYAEFIGGIIVFLGIATEAGAALLMIEMIVAIATVHWRSGFFIQNNGYEYALNLALLCLALIVGGPGIFALWDIFALYR